MIIVECIQSLAKKGGAETLFLNLCIELNKKDKLYVISLYSFIDPYVKEILIKNNVKLITIGKKKGIDFKAAVKFKSILLKINPDIINTHLGCIATYFLAFKFLKQKWVLVHTFHSIPKKESPFLHRFLIKFLIKKDLLFAVGISDLNKNLLIKYYKIKKNINVIYNGIPLFSFNDIKKYDFIICSRFVPLKNHLTLLKAIKKMNILGVFPSLICIGDGPTLDESKQYVLNNKIKNVKFTGYVDNVFPYLAQSKIFILPSFYEGNPISILEAMNFGLGIIASNVGGIPNIVNDGINGLLVNPHSPDELCKKMLILLRSKKIVDKMSSYNKSYIKRYSINKCANDYYDLFKKLIKD